MLEIGKLNTLEINKEVDFGLYLDGIQYDEILLPKRYVPEGVSPGDEIEVFIYLDSEDRLIATTEKPFVMVGECAYLKVVEANSIGAFLDWGLPKDLFVPFREQANKMIVGHSYCVKLYIDKDTDRIVASSKLNRHMPDFMPHYAVGQEVDVLIQSKTDLGFKAIVEDDFWGILYESETFLDLEIGDSCKAYIKKVREDGKLDLSINKLGYLKVDSNQQLILDKLQSCNGFLPFHDKSPAEEIQKELGMSKKAFKMTIGSLYKNKQIVIEKDGIRLL